MQGASPYELLKTYLSVRQQASWASLSAGCCAVCWHLAVNTVDEGRHALGMDKAAGKTEWVRTMVGVAAETGAHGEHVTGNPD